MGRPVQERQGGAFVGLLMERVRPLSLATCSVVRQNCGSQFYRARDVSAPAGTMPIQVVLLLSFQEVYARSQVSLSMSRPKSILQAAGTR